MYQYRLRGARQTADGVKNHSAARTCKQTNMSELSSPILVLPY